MKSFLLIIGIVSAASLTALSSASPKLRDQARPPMAQRHPALTPDSKFEQRWHGQMQKHLRHFELAKLDANRLIQEFERLSAEGSAKYQRYVSLAKVFASRCNTTFNEEANPERDSLPKLETVNMTTVDIVEKSRGALPEGRPRWSEPSARDRAEFARAWRARAETDRSVLSQAVSRKLEENATLDGYIAEVKDPSKCDASQLKVGVNHNDVVRATREALDLVGNPAAQMRRLFFGF